MEFEHQYYCKNCGKILCKSHDLIQQKIEMVCSRKECKKKQVVCGESNHFNDRVPIPIEAAVNREVIKQRFKREHNLRRKIQTNTGKSI
jgi:hypothetical protein